MLDRLQGFMCGPDRNIEVLLLVGRPHEEGFKLGGRKIDASIDHLAKKDRVGTGVRF